MCKTILAALALVTASIQPATAEIISVSTHGPHDLLTDDTQRFVVSMPWDGRTRSTSTNFVHASFWDYQVGDIMYSDVLREYRLDIRFKHTGKPHNEPGDQDGVVAGLFTIHVSISTEVFEAPFTKFYRINRMFDYHPHTPLPSHEDHAFAEICRDSPNPSYIRFTLWHVPAPGSLALTALGGMLAARRRR